MWPSSAAEAPPPAADLRRYFRVERGDLVYLKFILEAYDGMVTMTTVEPQGGVVRLLIPAAFAADMHDLLAALAGELPLQEIAFSEEVDDDA